MADSLQLDQLGDGNGVPRRAAQGRIIAQPLLQLGVRAGTANGGPVALAA